MKEHKGSADWPGGSSLASAATKHDEQAEDASRAKCK